MSTDHSWRRFHAHSIRQTAKVTCCVTVTYSIYLFTRLIQSATDINKGETILLKEDGMARVIVRLTVFLQWNEQLSQFMTPFHKLIRVWSSSQLVIRRTRLSTVGDRAFPVAGCRLWNNLPPDVTSASTLSFETASKLIAFPDHFLPNCFWFLVLHTVYSSGCICTLGHSK